MGFNNRCISNERCTVQGPGWKGVEALREAVSAVGSRQRYGDGPRVMTAVTPSVLPLPLPRPQYPVAVLSPLSLSLLS